jgi:DNA-binding response OmpR family regulator
VIGGSNNQSPSPVVLVVDANLDDCVLLGVTLRREGFVAESANTLAEARLLLVELDVDVVILDLRLPDGLGLDLVGELRDQRGEDVPFLVALTDRIGEADRLLGFEAGLDDYVTKPFSPQEVAFRVRAMLRRASHGSGPGGTGQHAHRSTVLRIGTLTLDAGAHEVRIDDREVVVTPVEFEILQALVEQQHLVLTRDHLIDRLWGASWGGDRHALDVHVSNLRRKLSDVPRDQTFVRSVRGVGYRIGSCISQADIVHS